jgi:protein TonB
MKMNARHLLLAATFAGGLLSAAQAAVVVSPLSIESPEFTAPVPAMVVAPDAIPRQYQNEVIRVSLTIDAQGRVHHADLLDGRDPGLVKRLLPAIAQWQFKPATKNGQPVAARVVLPLQLVESADS